MNANQDALVLIFQRNAFFKRLYYLALAALLLCFIAILFLSITLSFVFKHATHPLYFAADNVGRLIQVTPVNEPNMSTTDASAWAVEAVEAAYSYDYINYRSELQQAEKYFTSFGWGNYMNALKLSNNLLALTQRKQVVQAKVIETPQLVVAGLLGGRYAWKFQMPVLITYSEPPYDGVNAFSNALQVSVIVQRQPALIGYKGLGILQLVSTLSGG